MNSNKFALVGWLAVAHAIIYPVSIIMAGLEQGITEGLFDIERPIFGPSDILSIISTLFIVYILFMFKKLLNEHYSYHDLDLLLYIAIGWSITFEVVTTGLGLLMMIFWPVSEMFELLFVVFLVAAILSIGIIDILIAITFMKSKENFSSFIKVFAIVTLIAGICEVTVLLSPIALFLVPVSNIILALIFFRDNQAVEYV